MYCVLCGDKLDGVDQGVGVCFQCSQDVEDERLRQLHYEDMINSHCLEEQQGESGNE